MLSATECPDTKLRTDYTLCASIFFWIHKNWVLYLVLFLLEVGTPILFYKKGSAGMSPFYDLIQNNMI